MAVEINWSDHSNQTAQTAESKILDVVFSAIVHTMKLMDEKAERRYFVSKRNS